MIPEEGAAFLAPLFGNWAGKDDMTKYFFKDTPLAGLEQQMMTPPNFTPRGGGQMILCRFRYRPEDVDCKNCTEYRKKRDTLRVCPWLEERAEAGVVTYVVLASEFYKHWMDGLLGNRIRKVLSGKKAVTYYNEGHAARLQVYALDIARANAQGGTARAVCGSDHAGTTGGNDHISGGNEISGMLSGVLIQYLN